MATMTEEKILTASQQETLMNWLIEVLGPGRTIEGFIRAAGPEKLLAFFSKEEILAALMAKERDEMAKLLLAKFGPEQLRKMIDEISSNKSESH
jgi:hypothetical protein